MINHETFERILSSMHEAALDDRRWSAASALIDDALGVHGHCLAVVDFSCPENLQVYLAEFCYRGRQDHELEREYVQVYMPIDERVPRFMRLPDSQPVHMTNLFTAAERKTSLVYNELAPRMHAQNSLNVRLDGPDGANIYLGVLDPVVGNDWSAPQLELIGRLLPHLRQYVRVRQVLAGSGALGASLTELLDTTGAGIIQLDPRGRIVNVNDSAGRLLRVGDGLVDHDGFLFAGTPGDNIGLQKLLSRALPPFRVQGVSGSIMVRRQFAPSPLVLHVNPVDGRKTDVRAWPVAALVLVVDPVSWPHIDPAMVGQALGLTEMESRVAVLLAEGMSVRKIAARMGRKESTIRAHVKHMFAKHGVSRQAELVRLVLSLANAPEREATGEAASAPRQRRPSSGKY
ncbi:MAG: LuxR C-terminal-related transcriptional regulator [Deltaproteobacteria bacterium]|nr:LuxR C-terminal-related transcriptional regulator [Deltaproteobacteria bacterium]